MIKPRSQDIHSEMKTFRAEVNARKKRRMLLTREPEVKLSKLEDSEEGTS